MTADIIFENFPNLSDLQKEQFRAMGDLYQDWNRKINLVSRKDVDELYLRHECERLNKLPYAKMQFVTSMNYSGQVTSSNLFSYII